MTNLFENTIWPAFSQKLKSDKSCRNYRGIVNDFYRVTGKSFENCTKDDALMYDKYLSELEYSDSPSHIKHSTHVSRISCLRSLSDFIVKCNFIDGYENPFLYIVIKAEDSELDEYDIPTIEDMEHLFDAAASSPRDFLIFLLAGKCALSTSQICSLKMSDLAYDDDGELSGLTLRNGSYSHTILLTDDVMPALRNYLATKTPSDALFVNKAHKPIKPRDLQRLVKSYTTKLNGFLCKKDFTIAELRHAAIKYMLMGGATDEEIAFSTGAATPGMYSRYNKVSRDDMAKAVSYSILSVKGDSW